jgi:hypothetical protein
MMALLITFIAYHVALLVLKFKVHLNERRLFKEGVMPYGNEVRRGVSLSEDGKGVIEHSTKSTAWYARLAQKSLF